MNKKKIIEYLFVCARCHKIMPYHSKDMCRNCYDSNRNPRMRISRTKMGMLCQCGHIDKSVHGGGRSSPVDKCPHCGKYTNTVRVIYDRLTGEILEYYV